MIKIILLLLTLFFISSCSFKTPQNNWQYKSSLYFNSYSKNYLCANETLAKSDLNQAKSEASKSGNLITLSKIYLGECAIKTSVSNNTICIDYLNIVPLINDNKLDAYYALISKNITLGKIIYLPLQYQNFAKSLLQRNFTQANSLVQKMEPISSKLLAGALLQNEVTEQTIQNILDDASHHGYKKAVLFWLEIKRNKLHDKIKKEKIQKKILLLKSIN